MSDQTHTSQGDDGTVPTPPVIEGGDEIYNRIMREIEPDLTTENIGLLDEKYRDESEEEFKARMKRYAAAFEEYKKRSQEHQKNQKDHLRQYGKGVMSHVENASHELEDAQLAELESAIFQS